MRKLLLGLFLIIGFSAYSQIPPTTPPDPEDVHPTDTRIQGTLTIEEAVPGAPTDSALVIDANGLVKKGKPPGSGGSITDIAFDWNRNILRVWYPGLNIGADSVTDGLEWMFYTPPTISLNLSPTTTVYEVGTSNAITLSGATTDISGSSVLSNGYVSSTGITNPLTPVFSGSSSFNYNITFYPKQGGTADYEALVYTFRAYQDYIGIGESGTINSSNRTVQGVYPVFLVVSTTDYASSLSGFYTDASNNGTKLVQTEGNKTINVSGTGWIYYAIPTTWSDTQLSSIKDHSGFENITNFTRITGLTLTSTTTTPWTQGYVLYKYNNQVIGANYTGWQFIR